MIGKNPAHGAADSSIDSAMRLVAARHGERVKKNRAETIVPPLANAIHHTYSRIAKPQATGMLMPQIPTLLMNSQVSCTIKISSSTIPMPNPIHHHNGVSGLKTRLLTSSLKERNVTSCRTTGASAGRSIRTLTPLYLQWRDWGCGSPPCSWCGAVCSGHPAIRNRAGSPCGAQRHCRDRCDCRR